jgi:AcrR family transcriptional regulator
VSTDPPRTDTSARITEATFSLLAEHGLAGVTMSAIASRAGIARQTLYNHFPDVDSIVAAAMAQHHHDDLQALDAMLATIPTATGRLEYLVRHASVAAAQHGALPALHQGLSPSAQHATRQYDEQIRGMIRGALARGQQTGELAPTVDPELHAVLVHHLLHGAAELAATHPDDVTRITDATIDLLHAATHPRHHATDGHSTEKPRPA